MKLRSILTISLAASIFSALSASAASLDASLQPSQIALGESSRLTLNFPDGKPSDRPELPEVDGLYFQPAGQSSQISIVNGQMSSSVQLSYMVNPSRTGEFTIPAITARVDGQTVSSAPVTLTVSAKSAAPQVGGNVATAPGDVSDLAFMRVDREEKAREHLYVGEMTPVAIRAFIREGIRVSLNSHPSIAGSAYTLHGLSERPEQQSTVIGGQRYRVLTWYAGLSAVKPGDYPIEAKLDATLGVPQKSRRGRGVARMNSPFGASPFDDMFDDFFTDIEEQQVSLSSEKLPTEVQTLPQDGRPENFTGAVGQFALTGVEFPKTMETGSPETFAVTVTGRGNFDRVTMPTLSPAALWKTYAARDKTVAGDTIGYSAEKSFEMPAIALEPGQPKVQFSFSYFDPETGEYRSIESQSMALSISGSAVPLAENTPAETPVAASASGAQLAPLRASVGDLGNPKPLHARAWFLWLQALIGIVLVASIVRAGVKRFHERNPAIARRRALEKSVSEQQSKLEAAAVIHDDAAFFNAARRILQLHLADRWACNPDSITSEDLAQRLPGRSNASRIFGMADAIEFSGTRVDPDSFENWKSQLETAIAELQGDHQEVTQTNSHWGQTPQAA